MLWLYKRLWVGNNFSLSSSKLFIALIVPYNEMPSLQDIVFNSAPLVLQSFEANQWKGDSQEVGSELMLASLFGQSKLATPEFTSPDSVADAQTQKILSLPTLFGVANYTQTQAGRAVLMRSLQSPPLPLEVIVAKQEALRELEARPELKQALHGLLHSLVPTEHGFYSFMSRQYSFFFPKYSDYRETRSHFMQLAEGAQQLPKPNSSYLELLVKALKNSKDSDAFDLFEGPVFKTRKGLMPEKRMKFVSAFHYRLTLRHVKPVTFLPMVAWVAATAGLLATGNSEAAFYVSLFGMFPNLLLSRWSAFKPAEMDAKYFFEPLREKYLADKKFQQAFEALGRVDELLSFAQYAHATSGTMVLPQVEDAQHHYLLAKNARNPVLAKSEPEFVPSNIELNGQRLTFITGPNSGGKTTFCETAAQIQLLGQIGCYVPASYAQMSIADRIFYSGPEFASLQTEGRFGTELTRARNIFFSTTPRSLVIFDELAEGTTFEEKLRQSDYILRGFRAIGNNTILVTHNHQLVSTLVGQGLGIPLVFNFKGDKPTYVLSSGISTDSHAAQVAKKIGFSEQDVMAHLAKNGYVPAGTQHL